MHLSDLADFTELLRQTTRLVLSLKGIFTAWSVMVGFCCFFSAPFMIYHDLRSNVVHQSGLSKNPSDWITQDLATSELTSCL